MYTYFCTLLVVSDEAGPLEDYVEPEQLRVMLKRQLEYYFSRLIDLNRDDQIIFLPK